MTPTEVRCHYCEQKVCGAACLLCRHPLHDGQPLVQHRRTDKGGTGLVVIHQVHRECARELEAAAAES